MAGEEGTIRAQAKRAKAENRNGKEESVPKDGRERMDREIVKAVLASPLVTPWYVSTPSSRAQRGRPNIPSHLQKGVLSALPKLVPQDIADYHVSRARCHQKEKKHKRKLLKPKQGQDGNGGSVGDAESHAESSQALPARPVPPSHLAHVVLGINETIKELERNIDSLKLRLTMIADALNATHTSTMPTSGLLPTAPRSPSPDIAEAAPLGWIVVPLLSISPRSLVSPIPQYCATYNSLVYQWSQLGKTVRTRLKQDKWGVLGYEREEIRVVPLGDVEADMAKIAGLRRLACMGIRVSSSAALQKYPDPKASHPDSKMLHDLLPKSILHPPRHNITLPFPTSGLKVYTGERNEDKTDDPPAKKAKTSSLPIPNVHYAPLAVKGITTTVPTDGNAKKQKRLAEVKKRRLEVKEKKKDERRKEFLKGIKGDKPKVPRHGPKKGTKKA
jgi:hypothetical protein